MEKIVINLNADLKKRIKIEAATNDLSTKGILIGLFNIFDSSDPSMKNVLIGKIKNNKINT